MIRVYNVGLFCVKIHTKTNKFQLYSHNEINLTKNIKKMCGEVECVGECSSKEGCEAVSIKL